MEQKFSSKAIDHLGVVSGMCDQLNISGLIDGKIQQDLDNRNVSIGTIVKALILNGLGFTQRRLYMVPDFFSNKPVEILLGKGVEASQLNDSVIGRAMDSLYEYGCTRMFSELSTEACKILNLDSKFGHLDSTSLHLDGKYNSESPNPEGIESIHITQGYSRDHHSNLPQVVLNMITENCAGIPVHMQALDGNSSDKNTFRKTVTEHIGQLQNVHRISYLIADSALYCSKTIKEISPNTHWISRVPETISECKKLVIESDVSDMNCYGKDYRILPMCSSYGGVKQRWLLVWSSHAYNREIKTLMKNYPKKSMEEQKLFDKLCKKEFACQSDAMNDLEKFVKKSKYIEISQIEIVTVKKYGKRGRPSSKNGVVGSKFRLSGAVSLSLETFQKRKNRKGKFVLATNQLDIEELTDEQLFKGYKSQGKVERGFRFIKDPQFMASTFFVKKPERIEVLLMIMTLCLMVYAALEYRIRKELRDKKLTLPDQTGKPTQKPTARWIFALFAGIHILYTGDENKVCLNVKEYHTKTISMLGEQYLKYYLRE